MNTSDTPITEPIAVVAAQPINPILVTLDIMSEHGHTETRAPMEAISILDGHIKAGNWTYIGGKRFRSTAGMQTALDETPRARVTGTLRGGEGDEGTATAPAKKATKKKSASKAKAKKPAVKKTKAVGVTAGGTIMTTLPKVDKELTIATCDEAFGGPIAGEHYELVRVFIRPKADGGGHEVVTQFDPQLKTYAKHAASGVAYALKDLGIKS